jgi:hypothetical protein
VKRARLGERRALTFLVSTATNNGATTVLYIDPHSTQQDPPHKLDTLTAPKPSSNYDRLLRVLEANVASAREPELARRLREAIRALGEKPC